MHDDSDCPPLLLDDEENEITSSTNQQIQFSLWNTFKHHIPRFLLTAFVDIVLPLIIYFLLQKRTKPVNALLAAGIPPLLMVIIKGIISRTFDALGFIVFFGFGASAIAAIITQNPTIILLEKSLVTGLLSLVFGITLIPIHCYQHKYQIRPIAYYFYQDLIPTKRAQVGLPDIVFEDNQSIELYETGTVPQLTNKQEVSQVYEWIYAHCSSFRSACYLITSIWSIGLLLEFLARLFLILIHLHPEKIFIYGHIILTIMTNILIILTIICITKERKQTLKLIEKWKKQYLSISQRHSDVNLNIDI